MKNKKFSYRFLYFLAILLALPIFNFSYAKYANHGKEQASEFSSGMDSSGLQVRSIDTQVVSKHWNMTDKSEIRVQIDKIKDLGINYVAISTPYDHLDQMKIWTEAIHEAELNVWFRSHWLNWEGDEGQPSDMSMQEYLAKTSEFIKANPTLFKEGDSFTVCVEPEQIFVARKTNVYDWSAYNSFVVNQIQVANAAFSAIDLDKKVHANWISMNGWVVENGLTKDTVNKMGLITIDHYTNQKVIIPSVEFASDLEKDLKRIHDKWNKPIILGEWGYNIEQEVSDLQQKEVVSESLKKLSSLDFIIGLNYWNHMGNSSRLIDDQKGINLQYRPAALELKSYYNSK